MRTRRAFNWLAQALLCFAGATLAGSIGSALASKFRQELKACDPECTRFGNCNAETGECECRFGFAGPSCRRPLLPACHSAPATDVNGSVPLYDGFTAKNCYCLRQLQPLSCTDPGVWHNAYKCTQPVFWDWKSVSCYEYTGVPEGEQLSNWPEPGATNVVWKQGVWLPVEEGGDPFGLEVVRGPPERTRTNTVALPLSRCPERCRERGQCFSYAADGGDPNCLCAAFHEGPSCADTAAERCPLACSGQGTCHGGFCHCRPGYWSYGCSRSKAYVADEWSPHPTLLKIYVYDMPELVSYMKSDTPSWPDHFPIYRAETEFFMSLLADSTVRTENPWEANLFYIPSYTYFYIGNIGFPGQRFATVTAWARDRFPFWNMTGGRNHVLATSNDRGCCDLYRLSTEVQRPIKLVHFAQSGRGLPRGRRVDPNSQLDGGPLPHHVTSQLDDPAWVGAVLEYQHLASLGRARFRGFPNFQLPALQTEREACYRPEHDVAFPNYIPSTQLGGWMDMLRVAYVYDNDSYDGAARFNTSFERDMLFSFDGYNKEDMSYSSGVRQGLAAMFGNSTRPDVSINKGGGPSLMLRSRFCFAPMGFGWGVRLVQAVLAGCVPVLTQDHVWPMLWDVLPYERFSLRISRHNLHRLMDILEDVTPEQLRNLQDGLAEVHRAFIWQAKFGGQAYKYTLLSLHHRLLNMWTAVF